MIYNSGAQKPPFLYEMLFVPDEMKNIRFKCLFFAHILVNKLLARSANDECSSRFNT